MQNKSLFGTEVIAGTKFETKLRIFREKNYKFSLALLDAEQLRDVSIATDSRRLLNSLNAIGIVSDITHFFFWKQTRKSVLPRVYAWIARHTPLLLIKKIAFWVLYCFEWLISVVMYFFLTTIRYNFTSQTKMQVLHTRDFLFEVLKQAEEENRSITYIDLDAHAGKVVEDLVQKLFPELNFTSYIHSPRSITIVQEDGESTNENFFVANPEWHEVKNYLRQEKRDIVIFASRGAGDAELEFLARIKQDEKIHCSTLVIADAYQLSEKTTSASLSQQLSLMSTLVLEEFLHDLDQHQSWVYQLEFNIKTDQGKVVDAQGNLPSVHVPSIEKLEVLLIHILNEIFLDVKDVSINGKVRRTKQARIAPVMPVFRKGADYAIVRTVKLEIPMKYSGSITQLRPDFRIEK